jgi:hypothetical protein
MLQRLYSLSSHQVFIMDAIGAFISASMLGLVVATYEESFGLPAKAAHILALVALGFALYSSLCSWRLPAKWKRYMAVIMIANITYCVATAIVVLTYFQSLTALGLLYFGGEIAVIFLLVHIELEIYKAP